MEVPRLEVESDLQLPVYTTATATWDPSHVYDLHHSSQQCWILNPLIEARDLTWILMDTSQIAFHWATTGTPILFLLIICLLSIFFIAPALKPWRTEGESFSTYIVLFRDDVNREPKMTRKDKKLLAQFRSKDTLTHNMWTSLSGRHSPRERWFTPTHAINVFVIT